jgi:hypothetical protein
LLPFGMSKNKSMFNLFGKNIIEGLDGEML